VLLGCYLLDVGYPVLSDALDGKWTSAGRPAITDSLRGASIALAFLGVLSVAAASAVSVTSEREQDTWISLATTLLVPGEVIRAKQLGSVWCARWIGLALAITWAAGIICRALHPAGVFAEAVFLVLTAWVIAAIGVCASTLARNSTRALVTTFISLMLFSSFVEWPLLAYQLLVPLHVPVGGWWTSSAVPVGLIYSLLASVLGVLAVYAGIGAVSTIVAIWRLKARWGQ
jgi:hypothetical protein